MKNHYYLTRGQTVIITLITIGVIVAPLNCITIKIKHNVQKNQTKQQDNKPKERS